MIKAKSVWNFADLAFELIIRIMFQRMKVIAAFL